MRSTGFGQVLFAVSIATIGAFSFGFHGFAAAWELLPKWLVSQGPVVILASALLFGGGLGLLTPRAARMAALLLVVLFILRVLLLHLPRVATHPAVEVVWESMSENLIYIAGAWTISATPGSGKETSRRFENVRAGQILFALALPAIGLSHMFYSAETASLIPSWLPVHLPLAYVTGGAWIAAALGILFGVLARLAATLTAVMVSLFTLLIWIPMLIAAPTSVSNWSEMCTSAAITGAAWVVAESYRGQLWRFARAR